MSSKPELQQAVKLAVVNKQILEIKKKIQLSEGQRKALFEECEAERKLNADEILSLKKEIGELVIKLKENRSASAKNRIPCLRLEEVVGHIGDKTCSEVCETLDLQIIDKSKQLDLLRYQVKKRQQYLAKLANEYQILISGKIKRYTREKINKPIKKTKRELQNSIHAVEVQWREAEHVRSRYRDIRRSLQEDASRFESSIKRTEEQLQAQQIDIRRLQQINSEANRMRGNARGVLLQEERAALKSASTRDRQASDGKRLIVERRQELEKLEKRIFQGGKAVVRPETDGEDSNIQVETPTPPLHPVEAIAQAFEILMESTGGTSTEEVLERFCSQKETSSRLSFLRKSGDEQKRKLEVKHDHIAVQLETLKYAEVKDVEESAEEVEKMQVAILEQKQLREEYVQEVAKTKNISKLILESLQGIFLNINPYANSENEPLVVLQLLHEELDSMMKESEELEERKDRIEQLDEEKWLPPPYSSLIRRTPLPQQGASTAPAPPPGSDEEEEVPSRGYMKRQAQLVVDAKLRRKNIRFQVKK